MEKTEIIGNEYINHYTTDDDKPIPEEEPFGFEPLGTRGSEIEIPIYPYELEDVRG